MIASTTRLSRRLSGNCFPFLLSTSACHRCSRIATGRAQDSAERPPCRLGRNWSEL